MCNIFSSFLLFFLIPKKNPSPATEPHTHFLATRSDEDITTERGYHDMNLLQLLYKTMRITSINSICLFVKNGNQFME